MKGFEKKAFLFLIFIGLMTGSFLGAKLIEGHIKNNKPLPRNINLKSVPKIIQVEPNRIETDHPYGRPVVGPLFWENDRQFHELCAKYGITVRMSAFETTLPDPLPGEEFNVALAADILTGTVVPPGKIFSTNKIVGPYSRQRGFQEGPAYYGTQIISTIGGGVCKIATTLYNVAVLADLKIIERRPHGMLVPYVPPGQDATVAEGSKDFKFKNSTNAPILIWADTKENTLYMAVYGRVKPAKITWRHQILYRQPMKIVYRYNPRIKPGEEKVIIPGADGVTVKSWLLIEDHKKVLTKRYLGIDYYRPMLRVIERGIVK